MTTIAEITITIREVLPLVDAEDLETTISQLIEAMKKVLDSRDLTYDRIDANGDWLAEH